MADRLTFTRLAELAGRMQAGRVSPTEYVEQMLKALADEAGLKPDKFTVHAETERIKSLKRADALLEGDNLQIDGLILQVDEVNLYSYDVIVVCKSDSATDDEAESNALVYRFDNQELV